MGATQDNLKSAFAGESQANRRYLAFAAQADQDGLPMVARLFRAAADAETVHALAHLRVLKAVKSTSENLKTAVEGEGFEYRQMYPGFLTTAHQEGARAAAGDFSNALEAERVHHRLYSEAAAKVQAGEDLAERPVFVCQVCGNTVWGQPPNSCPICSSPKEMFKKVD
jgi:rubrerythrin